MRILRVELFREYLVLQRVLAWDNISRPDPIVKLMVNAVAPTEKDLILDPFAGSGHFLTQCLLYVKHNATDIDEKRFNEFAFHKLHGIEKSERMVRVAMTDMRLHGDGHSNIRCTDATFRNAKLCRFRTEFF